MKKSLLLSLFILVMAVSPVIVAAQTDNQTGRFSVINEYGPFFGQNTVGFTGTFVAGYTFPNQKEMLGLGVGYEVGGEIGQGLPVFFNFRHIFKPNRSFSPIVNVAAGIRYCVRHYYVLDQNVGYYLTISSGFQAKLFSFSGGLFFKSYGTSSFYTGLEIKCGYKL
jgi:hypothetical protein